MEHHFTGPSFTIGIEEELMIVDEDSLELVNAIESLLQDAVDGEIKPELMESVLEIATKPCNNTVEAGAPPRGRAAARAAPAGPGQRGRQGADDRLGGHASVRDVGGRPHRRPAALPRAD